MTLLLKNLLFTVFVPGTVGVYLPLWIAGGRGVGSGLAFALGCGLLLLGACIYAWCVWDFASFGRGTPAPIDAPKRLVMRGLYRYTRNPMYVGVLSVILGFSAVFQAPAVLLYGLVVTTAFNLFVRLYEEPHLAGEFGEEYRDYCRRVGRWLPGIGVAPPP
jgi:protein-S-isoprenylcysteine O-methyltransferase Ste14